MTPPALTIRTTTGADLEAHHSAWTGANAKARAAAAARDYDHAALWSLVAAMLAEGDGVSKHTAAAYRTGVLRFTRWAEREGVALLHPDRSTGLRYRHDLMRAHGHEEPDGSGTRWVTHPGTINTRLSGARALYRAFAWVGLEHADPLKGVKSVKDGRAPEAVRAAYSHADVARLLEACDDPHDRVAVLLGADAGLRAAEMLTLTWAHVTMPPRAPTGEWAAAGSLLVHGKGGKVAPVPFGDELADALEAVERRDGPVLAHVRSASGLRYRVARLAHRAGLIDAKPNEARDGRTLGLHRLRHRYGTDVVKAHGLAVGQAALRHSNPQTTARYAKEREHQVAAFVRALRRG